MTAEKAGRPQRPTDDSAERAALLARAVGDFRVFCRSLVTIKTKNRELTNLRLNPIQARYQRARSPRDVVLKPRQIGLSTVEFARDVWRFLEPGANVVIFCQTDKDSSYKRKFSADIERIFDGLGRAGLRLDFGSRAVGTWSLPKRDSFLQIVEAGASVAAAQKKGRGGTYTRVHSTEAAFYEHPEIALNAALEGVPNLPGTEIVFESTANGAGTWFHGWWNAAVARTSGYKAHFFAWFDDPSYATPLEEGEVVEPRTEREQELVERFRVTPEQLKWYRAKVEAKGQPLTDQEYPSDPDRCFLVSGRTYFDREVTERLYAKTREPISKEWHDALHIFERVLPCTEYVVIADPSEGTGGDPGASTVHERESGRHVATLYGQFGTWEFGRLLAQLGTLYNYALVVVERNNHGHAVLQSLEQGQKYSNIYAGPDEKLGWLTNAIRRSSALEALYDAHRLGQWETPDRRILAEMRTFVVGNDGKAQAAPGSHDDLVITEAIAHDVLSKPHGGAKYDESLDQYLPSGMF